MDMRTLFGEYPKLKWFNFQSAQCSYNNVLSLPAPQKCSLVFNKDNKKLFKVLDAG